MTTPRSRRRREAACRWSWWTPVMARSNVENVADPRPRWPGCWEVAAPDAGRSAGGPGPSRGRLRSADPGVALVVPGCRSESLDARSATALGRGMLTASRARSSCFGLGGLGDPTSAARAVFGEGWSPLPVPGQVSARAANTSCSPSVVHQRRAVGVFSYSQAVDQFGGRQDLRSTRSDVVAPAGHVQGPPSGRPLGRRDRLELLALGQQITGIGLVRRPRQGNSWK